MTSKDLATGEDFTSYYLQQSTKEFAEDLDKVRSADDFKGDALPLLIKSLQQGTSMFSAADQRRVVDARQASAASKGHGDGEAGAESADADIVTTAAMAGSTPLLQVTDATMTLHSMPRAWRGRWMNV
ncbi:ribosome-assembly protein 3-domain-containing protein [Nemania sp. NC0429]|nr:ribosome-assembly protein 3-domain-containing protein [Nemania sp. NC0429]